MTIRFYSKRSLFFELSNFYRSPFTLDGKSWQTVEHYFQAQKFTDLNYKEQIRSASSPTEAKHLGQTRSIRIRDDWEDVKENMMYDALCAKFSQNSKLRELLMLTGEERLEEDSPKDKYWGRLGKNRLGVLLMKLRRQLR